MKKKLVSILLCTAMTASLAVGCGSDTQEKSTDESTDNTEAAGDSDVQADPVDKEGLCISGLGTECD